MANVFDQFKLENKEIEVKDLGKVTIRPLALKEFMGMADKFGTKDKTKMLQLQFEVVSRCLVEPKMTVKQLESLGQKALDPVTEIFVAIQGQEEGN